MFGQFNGFLETVWAFGWNRRNIRHGFGIERFQNESAAAQQSDGGRVGMSESIKSRRGGRSYICAQYAAWWQVLEYTAVTAAADGSLWLWTHWLAVHINSLNGHIHWRWWPPKGWRSRAFRLQSILNRCKSFGSGFPVFRWIDVPSDSCSAVISHRSLLWMWHAAWSRPHVGQAAHRWVRARPFNHFGW